VVEVAGAVVGGAVEVVDEVEVIVTPNTVGLDPSPTEHPATTRIVTTSPTHLPMVVRRCRLS
jgi:hypothetical protein